MWQTLYVKILAPRKWTFSVFRWVNSLKMPVVFRVPIFQFFFLVNVLGGYVAMNALLKRQRENGSESNSGSPRISSLVVGCSHFGGHNAVPVSPIYTDLWHEIEKTPRDSELWDSLVRDFFALNFTPQYVRQERSSFESLLEPYRLSLYRDDKAGMQYQMNAVQDFYRDGMESRLAEIRVPTLVLTGGDDEIVMPSNSNLLHGRIPGAELRIMPQVGHMFFEQDPCGAAQAVSHFLDSAKAQVPPL
jgi:pimeloyl-ACP methyl ester carboxylesterase